MTEELIEMSSYQIDGKVIKRLQSNFTMYQGVDTLREFLDLLALQIRELVGAHQSAVSFVPDGDFVRASHATSFTDEYAKYCVDSVLPIGRVIWAMVLETGLSIRITQEALRLHPQFKVFFNLKSNAEVAYPSTPGWLAVPIKYKNEKTIGMMMVSDKYEGDFTEADQATLEKFAVLVGETLEVECANRELLRANAELLAKRKELERLNEELNQFTYIASHDLQTPLASIIGFSDLLQRKSNLSDEKMHDYLARISDAARRMSQLIHDLLSYSRLTTSEHVFESVDLNAVYQAAVDNLERVIKARQAKLHVGHLPVIRGIKTQFVQLFQNLISNSLKYCSKDKVPELTIALMEQNGMYHILFRDNGIGIESKYHEKIFEPFKRLHASSDYEGTGIGLSICKKIVEQHHGSIHLESDLGMGSTFIVILPKVMTP